MALSGTCEYTITEDGRGIRLSFSDSIFPQSDPPPPIPAGLVVLQSVFSPPNGWGSFPDDTGRHTVTGNRQPDGLWSFNESFGYVADSEDWDLTPGSVVEYIYKQSNTASNYDVLTNASGAAQTGWAIRHNGGNGNIAWFDLLGVHHTAVFPLPTIVPMQEFDVRVEIPATAFIRPSAQTLKLNMSGAGQQAWMRKLKITKAA